MELLDEQNPNVEIHKDCRHNPLRKPDLSIGVNNEG